QIGLGEVMHDFTHTSAGRTRDRNQSFIGSGRICDLSDARDRTADLDAADVRSPLRAVIVDESDYLHPQLSAVFDLARERFAGIAGSNDQNALLSVGNLACTKTIAAESDHHPRSEKGEQREGPLAHHNGSRRMY